MTRLATRNMCSRRSELIARSRCASANLQTLRSVCDELDISSDPTICFVTASHHAQDCFVGVMPDSATSTNIRGRDELYAFLKGVRQYHYECNWYILKQYREKYNVSLIGNHIWPTTVPEQWLYYHSDAVPQTVHINGIDNLQSLVRGPSLLLC